MMIKRLGATLLMAGGLTVSAHAGLYTWNIGDLGDLAHQNAYTWGVSTSNAQGIDLYNQLSSNAQMITGATLTFSQIQDWTAEDDRLQISLLDETRTGVRSFTDNTGDTLNGNAFAAQNGGSKWNGSTYMGYWTDPEVQTGTKWVWQNHHLVQVPVYGPEKVNSLVYDLANPDTNTWNDVPGSTNLLSVLTSYILGNNGDTLFGIGFDPDCHYYNCGVTFQITTADVPNEPHEPTVPEPASMALIGMGLAGIGALRRRRSPRA